MKVVSIGSIGISIGSLIIGGILATLYFCLRDYNKRLIRRREAQATTTIRENVASSSTIQSDSTIGPDQPVRSGRNRDENVASSSTSAPGILVFSYKYVFGSDLS